MSSLPMDFQQYYFLQSLSPMGMQSPPFDPFALYSQAMQQQGGGGGGPRGLNPSICKFYAGGHCARGDQCNYAHVRADGTNVSSGHMRGPLPHMRGRGRGSDMRGGIGGRGRGAMRGGAAFRGSRLPEQQYPSHMLHPGHGTVKDGMHGGPGMGSAGNPLSPLSPSLVGMHGMGDPSLLLHSPQFAPLDYTSGYNPWGGGQEGYFDLSSTLGVGLNASPGELVGRVYTLAKDQYGCRLLQRLLDDPHRLGVLDVIYDETFAHLTDLMTDPFGNYLCQKLIEQCSEAQRLSILAKVAPNLISISLNLHGTRAVQKLVETLTSPSETELLVESLKQSVIALVKDLNGNHVVQRCLHHLSSQDNQFIYDAIARHCVSVSTHKHGCCVLQRALDYSTAGQKRQLIAEICSNALELVQDAFGNYVIQYVLDLGDAQATATIITNLLSHIGALSVQKFSSNVIEKCFAPDTLINTGDGLSRPIQLLTPGDRVLSKRQRGLGMGEVSRAWKSGRREVVRVELEDGRCLRCTADHRIMTTKGWQRVEEMRVDDTQLILGPEGVEDRLDELEAAFTFDLPHLSLSMKENRRRCLAVMRLAGYRCGQWMRVTDDDDEEALVVQHVHDRLCVEQDVELISGDDCHFSMTKDGSWSIALPLSLTSTDCLRCLHLLLRQDCPAALRREFLAACFGACGHVDLKEMIVAFHGSSLRPLAVLVQTHLPTLLANFHPSNASPSLDVNSCTFNVTVPFSSFLIFADCIGSRYNVAQSCLLSVASSYHGHCQRWPASPPPFPAYCERIGCSDWLLPSSSAFSSSSLPTFRLRVTAISPAGLSDVFDLTVSSPDPSPSFLAHGVLAHNCLELANDKLRSRMIDELVNPERLPRLLQDPYAKSAHTALQHTALP